MGMALNPTEWMPSRLFISAGEVSGDMHAAGVVESLLSRFPHVKVAGIAGPAMQRAGCEVLQPMESLNVMGLGDVVRALPRIRRIEREILAWCEENRPEVAVLVDFPGFHMRLGRKLRSMGIPVVQYIAPKLWAWGAWRAKKLAQSQDRLACIFPFETDWFGGRGIKTEYVGNPSAYACRSGWSNGELKARLGLPEHVPLLALLPGSRRSELATHVPLLAEAWQEIKSLMPEARSVVALAPGVEPEAVQLLLDAGALLLERDSEGYALRADAALAVSGTATLELALWNVPTVLVYRSSPVWMFLARKLVRLNCAGLANILLGDEPVMPELIQADCTVEQMVAEIMPLLRNEPLAARQRESFSRLRRMLGGGDPGDAVAELVSDLARHKALLP